jgi:hypothetical protein
MHHPLVVAIFLGFDFQPHDVQCRSGVNLRVFGDIALQQEKLAGSLGEIVQCHAGGGVQRHDGAVAREHWQGIALHGDGARSLGQLVGFQVGPVAARKVDAALVAGFVERRHQHLVAQQEFVRVERALTVVRHLQGQGMPDRRPRSCSSAM